MFSCNLQLYYTKHFAKMLHLVLTSSLFYTELSLKNSFGIPFLIFCEMFWKKNNQPNKTASVVPLIVMYIKGDTFPECSNSTFWLSLYLEKLKLKTSNSNLTY